MPLTKEIRYQNTEDTASTHISAKIALCPGYMAYDDMPTYQARTRVEGLPVSSPEIAGVWSRIAQKFGRALRQLAD